MTHISYEPPQATASRGGGRISCDKFRHSQNLSNSFLGLEQNTSRYDLLLLVKRVGKQAGFTPRMIQLLDYYMAYTTALDWEEGSRPIVFQSLSRTALDLGVTERQIQKLEKQLFEIGAITWNDSGNHKRYGHRNPKTGRLSYAYGVELTPLAFLKPELEAKLQEKLLYAKAWQETKREISAIRRQIRSLILEWQADGSALTQLEHFEQAYQAIAVPIRTYIDLANLRELLARHGSLLTTLLDALQIQGSAHVVETTEALLTENSSYKADNSFAHKEQITPDKKNDTPCKPGGVNLSQLVRNAGKRFRENMPIKRRTVGWSDFIEAADRTRKDLRIGQDSWTEACQAIGREGAAIIVLLIDKRRERGRNQVRYPAAYFLAIIRKASGERINLDRLVCELLTANSDS